MWDNLVAKRYRAEAGACVLERESQFVDSEPYKSIRDSMRGLHQIVGGGAIVSSDSGVVSIGSEADLGDEQHLQLERLIRSLLPWRKGPYNLFGHSIHSEWRSNLKWERIRSRVLPVDQKVLCDLGCNNGFMLFKLLRHKPRYLLGMDPCPLYRAQFELLNGFLGGSIDFKPLGHEHMNYFEKVFDVVLCLGILYHHPDPIGILRRIHVALKPKGMLLVDCQGIPGEEPVALFPRKRYAQSSGMWFLPTTTCLKHWLYRAGFRDVDVFYEGFLSPSEQARSLHSPHGSLSEGLSAGGSNTTEGYPAPIRIYLTAYKG